MILGFLMLSFKPAYSLSYFTLIKTLFSSSLLSAIRVVTSAYLKWLTLLGSKLGKEYVKAVYCHPVYLTYMQSTSCEIPG